ncbi:hypothetical protein K7X08_033770 [Anisodus acutangulus]|uniref:Uncharacterized protein n=1 Tax=Anisodus acutangulus TaxID=402998 RepID=A0A9Q1M2P9_9SOLA|nr:hypothetical protein K7X08_033770 [Anisodus acutangulus]
MAIELCSSDESSLGIMSPARISFDISPTGTVPVEQYIRSTSPSSSIDFDFCVFRESFDLESSSADELFFDGKILPIEIKRRLSSTQLKKTEQQLPPPHPMPTCKNSTNTSNTCDKMSIENKRGVLETSDEKQNSKSFWRFKRSSSLNCGSGYARTLCPLPLLSRSNSTGSTPSVKQTAPLLQVSESVFLVMYLSPLDHHLSAPPCCSQQLGLIVLVVTRSTVSSFPTAKVIENTTSLAKKLGGVDYIYT